MIHSLLGAAGTWLALRLVVFAGSITVHLSVPFGLLWVLVVIWTVVILVARLITLCLILWLPLTGRFGLKALHIRRLHVLRNGILVVLFGVVSLFVL